MFKPIAQYNDIFIDKFITSLKGRKEIRRRRRWESDLGLH